MDFQQRKLTKSEWESIEIPVSSEENEILNLINDGYSNVNIKYNKTHSLFNFLKVEYSEQLEDYLYTKYFADLIKDFISKYNRIKMEGKREEMKTAQEECVPFSEFVFYQYTRETRIQVQVLSRQSHSGKFQTSITSLSIH